MPGQHADESCVQLLYYGQNLLQLNKTNHISD